MNARFKEIALLGRGGMGDVFLASSLEDESLVVLKRLRTDIADESEFCEMFLQEARLAMRLTHPNIVSTFEVGQDDKSHFIAMEYLEGQSMYAVLRRARKVAFGMDTAPPSGIPALAAAPAFPLNMHVRIIADCLRGLHFAHELRGPDGRLAELVHRDLSPANVFVTYDGNVKLLDFGIAKAADSQSHTRTGIIKGKIAYMAPERFKMRTLDRRSDVFSAGSLLWEAASGSRLWAGVPDLEIFSRVASGKIPRPSEVNPSVSTHLEQICMRALAVQPDERYQTAEELRIDLEGWLLQAGSVLPHELGEKVVSLFTKERAEVERILKGRRDEKRASLRQLPTVKNDSERSLAVESIESAPTELAKNPAAAALQAPAKVQASNTDGRTQVMDRPHLAPHLASNHGQAFAAAPNRPPVPILHIVLTIFVSVAVVTLGFAIFAVATRKAPPVVEVTHPLGSVPTAVSVPGQKTVKIHVQTNVAKAAVYIDDALVGPSPYNGELPGEIRSHAVRIEAPGYTPYSELVMPQSDGRDISIQVRLVKK